MRFTIHHLDEALVLLLRAKARDDGTSLNETIKGLLEGALGVRPPASINRKHFEKFCGMWSSVEPTEFARATKDFEAVQGLRRWPAGGG